MALDDLGMPAADVSKPDDRKPSLLHGYSSFSGKGNENLKGTSTAPFSSAIASRNCSMAAIHKYLHQSSAQH
jgi:hypothetical protein